MTDPTPTRAEVERFGLRYNSADDCDEIAPRADGPYVRFTDYQALRERAEAAEAQRDEARAAYLAHKRLRIDAEQQAHAARSAEAAAWNDAIEAGWAYIETCLDEPETDADAALISDMEEGFRALLRAAPMEGEA